MLPDPEHITKRRWNQLLKLVAPKFKGACKPSTPCCHAFLVRVCGTQTSIGDVEHMLRQMKDDSIQQDNYEPHVPKSQRTTKRAARGRRRKQPEVVVSDEEEEEEEEEGEEEEVHHEEAAHTTVAAAASEDSKTVTGSSFLDQEDSDSCVSYSAAQQSIPSHHVSPIPHSASSSGGVSADHTADGTADSEGGDTGGGGSAVSSSVASSDVGSDEEEDDDDDDSLGLEAGLNSEDDHEYEANMEEDEESE